MKLGFERLAGIARAVKEAVGLEKPDTPNKLAKSFERNIATIKEYLPYLREDMKDLNGWAMVGRETNAVVSLMDESDAKKRLEAEGKIGLHLKAIIKKLENYLHDSQNGQVVRVGRVADKFLDEVEYKKLRDFEVVLQELVDGLNQI